MITVNLNKAKEITKDRLRVERAPLLEKLDVEFMRAVEVADTAKQLEVATQKQALRDVTKLADSCTTLDQLSALSCENTNAS